MKIVKVDLGLNHEIALFGDIHEGSVMKNDSAVDETIGYIKSSKKIYTVLMGDYCEAKTVDHPHYQREVHESTVMEQYQIIRDKLIPIRSKVIIALEGNHDWRLSRKIGNTVKTLICDPLRIKFGGYSSVIWVMDGQKLLYKIYATHGAGSINSRIDDPDERRHSMERALKRKLFLKFSDALVMASGHNHRLIVKSPSSSLELKTEERLKENLDDKVAGNNIKMITCDEKHLRVKSFYSNEVVDASNGYILPSNRWYVSTGGYLKLYADDGEITGYQEVSGLDPLEIGFAKIICIKGKVEVKRVVLG